MAADIMLFNSKYVPVGQDQKQHVEIARDIAQYFNKKYGKSLMVPNAKISEEVATLTGLDGRKMSKSYNNVIPLFCSEKQLNKCVMSIKTDCAGANDPKDTNSILFTLYKLFASAEQIAAYEQAFHDGILWSEAKKQLFEVMNAYLLPMREKYDYYKGDIERREMGSLIAFENGESIVYGLYNAQERGTLFIGAGVPVYGGMVVGENPRGGDLVVNVCKRKNLTNVRSSASDEALRLTPPKNLSLEECLEFLNDDELLEVTPKSIRIRKKILDHTIRGRVNFHSKND